MLNRFSKPAVWTQKWSQNSIVNRSLQQKWVESEKTDTEFALTQKNKALSPTIFIYKSTQSLKKKKKI